MLEKKQEKASWRLLCRVDGAVPSKYLHHNTNEGVALLQEEGTTPSFLMIHTWIKTGLTTITLKTLTMR